ncbi:hypothetical protein AAEP93_003943 [Penicillium crustosum]
MTVIETTFDFILKLTTEFDDLVVEMTTIETPSPKLEPSYPLQHYRIFPEYGTDFLWRAEGDIGDDQQGYTESEEELSSYPSSVLEVYYAWDYHAPVFAGRIEQVAWNVAGYMLAWRIVLSPGVGSIEYTPGFTDYLLQRGKESTVMEGFLRDQIELFAIGAKGLP